MGRSTSGGRYLEDHSSKLVGDTEGKGLLGVKWTLMANTWRIIPGLVRIVRITPMYWRHESSAIWTFGPTTLDLGDLVSPWDS